MDRFLEKLAETGAIRPACKLANVGKTTVYEQLKEDPDFKREVDEVLASCVEEIEHTLFQQANQATHPAYVFGYLKARKPEVYGDKLRQDQIDQIKQDTRREVIGELEEQLALLTPQARAIVQNALGRVAAKELPPGGTS